MCQEVVGLNTTTIEHGPMTNVQPTQLHNNSDHHTYTIVTK